MCSVAIPDTQLFAISTNKITEKKLQQRNYNTENSERA